jgi:hypothetical protein
MPILKEIFAQPVGGWPDRPWDRDASLDAFGRLAVGVGAQLSTAVAAVELSAAYRQFRISTVPTTAASVGVDSIELKRMGWEGCRAEIPHAFAQLDRVSQLETVRRTFALALRAHAELRSWDRPALESALALGLEDDPAFSWEGERRMSKGRRHSAVLHGRFLVDGYARVSVVFRDEESGRERDTQTFRCGSSLASLKRTDATAGWLSSMEFAFDAGTDQDDRARVVVGTYGEVRREGGALLPVAQPAEGLVSGPLEVVPLPAFRTRRFRK